MCPYPSVWMSAHPLLKVVSMYSGEPGYFDCATTLYELSFCPCSLAHSCEPVKTTYFPNFRM